MNKLLVQNTRSKFIQNLVYCQIEDTKTIGPTLDNNIYKIYYSYRPTHIVFSAENITPEIIQFISDFSNSVKCFIYHDQITLALFDNLKSFPIYHIVGGETTKANHKCIVYPKNLINSQLFYNSNGLLKNESIICFLDGEMSIREELNKCLYPNTSLPIKLFNNPSIRNYQNLGLVNEPEKARILQHNRYYLSLGNGKNDYSTEARACGCSVVSLENIKDYLSITDSGSIDTTEYQTFIKERILI